MKAIGQLVDGDVILCEGCVFDYLTIQWDNVNLSQHDLNLWSPSSPLSIFDIKILFEDIIQKFHYLIQNYYLQFSK